MSHYNLYSFLLAQYVQTIGYLFIALQFVYIYKMLGSTFSKWPRFTLSIGPGYTFVFIFTSTTFLATHTWVLHLFFSEMHHMHYLIRILWSLLFVFQYGLGCFSSIYLGSISRAGWSLRCCIQFSVWQAFCKWLLFQLYLAILTWPLFSYTFLQSSIYSFGPFNRILYKTL